jgi:hypothetical protein
MVTTSLWGGNRRTDPEADDGSAESKDFPGFPDRFFSVRLRVSIHVLAASGYTGFFTLVPTRSKGMD